MAPRKQNRYLLFIGATADVDSRSAEIAGYDVDAI